MATRTSLYGSVASMIPDWVFGGEYGDLTKLMNAREASYENLWQEQERTRMLQQQTADNQQRLEDAARKRQVDDSLRQAFEQSQPADLRSAYQNLIDASLAAGDVDGAISAMEKQSGLDQKKQARELADLQTAGRIAQTFGPDVAEQYFPGVIPPTALGNLYRKGVPRPTQERTIKMFDMKQGVIADVPVSEAEQKQINGSHVRLDDPRIASGDIQLPAFGGASSQSQPPPPSSGESWLPYQVTPVPTPTVGANPRGDVARQGPSVQDRVMNIKRNRQVK